MFIGSLEGHVIHTTWAGYEFDCEETINSEGKCNIYYIYTASKKGSKLEKSCNLFAVFIPVYHFNMFASIRFLPQVCAFSYKKKTDLFLAFKVIYTSKIE